jgi:hypothetical protein
VCERHQSEKWTVLGPHAGPTGRVCHLGWRPPLKPPSGHTLVRNRSLAPAPIRSTASTQVSAPPRHSVHLRRLCERLQSLPTSQRSEKRTVFGPHILVAGTVCRLAPAASLRTSNVSGKHVWGRNRRPGYPTRSARERSVRATSGPFQLGATAGSEATERSTQQTFLDY